MGKVEAILQMDRPRDATALRGFIGAGSFYKELCPSRAHVLKPLTLEMEEAFKKMKHVLALGALTA